MGFIGTYRLADPDIPRCWLYLPDPENPLTYCAENGRRYVMDQEFLTDGATTGRIAGIVPGLGQWDWPKAALLHDWLWEQRKTGRLAANFCQSNKLLEEAIVSLGWNKWVGLAVRLATTAFGWIWWLRGEGTVEEAKRIAQVKGL